MNYLLKKLWFNVKQRGMFAIIVCILYRFLQKIAPLEVIIFFEKSLTEPIHAISLNPEISFRIGTQQDIKHLNMNENQLSMFEKHEISKDHDCYVGVLGDIVSYIWVNHNYIFNDTIFDRTLSSKNAYLFRGFTHPNFRGLQIFPTILLRVCQELQRNGVDKCFMAANIGNRSSIRSIHKAGFLKTGYLINYKTKRESEYILPKIIQTLTT